MPDAGHNPAKAFFRARTKCRQPQGTGVGRVKGLFVNPLEEIDSSGSDHTRRWFGRTLAAVGCPVPARYVKWPWHKGRPEHEVMGKAGQAPDVLTIVLFKTIWEPAAREGKRRNGNDAQSPATCLESFKQARRRRKQGFRQGLDAHKPRIRAKGGYRIHCAARQCDFDADGPLCMKLQSFKHIVRKQQAVIGGERFGMDTDARLHAPGRGRKGLLGGNPLPGQPGHEILLPPPPWRWKRLASFFQRRTPQGFPCRIIIPAKGWHMAWKRLQATDFMASGKPERIQRNRPDQMGRVPVGIRWTPERQHPT